VRKLLYYSGLVLLAGYVLLTSGCASLGMTPRGSGHPAQVGVASYYGHEFHGRKTASGEIYNENKLTAAHPRLPFGSTVKVVNLSNNKSVVVRINDRGPFVSGRIIDLSYRAAQVLEFVNRGTAKVKLEIVEQAQG